MRLNKDRLLKVIIGILLLVVMAFFSSIWSTDGSFAVEIFGTTVLAFLFLGCITMIIPVGAWLMGRGKLGRKNGIIVCIVNGLILFVPITLFFLRTIIINEPCPPAESICPVALHEELLKIVSLIAIWYCLANICFWVDFQGENKD
ncbi:hypothetical protein IKF30_00685 [Candidatus Saccharibacteria bacterium]|nr:hypothetical protein [Candidatus Saccharibacteria bacterium]